jgi:hypothetical protein
MNAKVFAVSILAAIGISSAGNLASRFCEQDNPSFAFSKVSISEDRNLYWKIECGCNCTGDFFSTVYFRWNKGEKPKILLSVSDIQSCSVLKPVTNQVHDLELYTREEDEDGVQRIPVYDTVIFNGERYVPKNKLRNVTLATLDTVALVSKIERDLANPTSEALPSQASRNALSLFKSGSKLAAADTLLKAVGPKPWTIDNSNVSIFNDLGFFLEESGRYQESIDVLSAVIAKFPDRMPAYLNIADAYAGLKNNDKAKENYKKYVELMTKAGKQSKIPERAMHTQQ